jgi:lipopolysaccharide cholinephosphotransferase
MYNGVWIDIFPLSGIPEDKRERGIFYKKGVLLNRINIKTKMSFLSQRTLKGKVAWILFLPLRIVPNIYWWETWKNELKKYPLYESTYTGHVWGMLMRKRNCHAECFSGYIEFPFEDTAMRCPKGYDEYLTKLFGDYMKLPPKENRVLKHGIDGGIIDLNTPYKVYAERKYKEKNIRGKKA